jgi:hypothetical protein
MKTHPESIWLGHDDIGHARSSGRECFSSLVSLRVILESDLEFVPAAAYVELKTQLADIWPEGYVAGQAAIKEGKPQRNPHAVVEETS